MGFEEKCKVCGETIYWVENRHGGFSPNILRPNKVQQKKDRVFAKILRAATGNDGPSEYPLMKDKMKLGTRRHLPFNPLLEIEIPVGE